jgi:type VI secretion system secreted protein Hcp
MAYQFYLTVKGQKQGEFKGEGRRKGKIEVRGFEHTITSPRDTATGQASGKRQHSPLKIYKEWGPATVQFFEALVTNENLTSVHLEAYRPNPAGKEEVYFTITLTDATVSSLHEVLDNALHGSVNDTHELEVIEFTYRKIEVTNKVSNTSAVDDWMVNTA